MPSVKVNTLHVRKESFFAKQLLTPVVSRESTVTSCSWTHYQPNRPEPAFLDICMNGDFCPNFQFPKMKTPQKILIYLQTFCIIDQRVELHMHIARAPLSTSICPGHEPINQPQRYTHETTSVFLLYNCFSRIGSFLDLKKTPLGISSHRLQNDTCNRLQRVAS